MEKPRLLDQTRERCGSCITAFARKRRISSGSSASSVFHGKRHPAEMGEREITAFSTDLAVNRYVAPSAQHQALAALLFLYRMVLETDLPWLEDVVRTKRLLACAHAPISWFAAVVHDCEDKDVILFN